MLEAEQKQRPWPHIWAISSVLSALALLFLAESGALEAPQIYILAALPIGLMVMTVVSGLTSAKKTSVASHRYLGRMALTMAFYLVTLFLAEHFIEDRGVSGAGAAILAGSALLCWPLSASADSRSNGL